MRPLSGIRRTSIYLLTILFAGCGSLSAAPQIRFFLWNYEDKYDTTVLDYYSKLGYTHVGFHVPVEPMCFKHITGKWVYNDGNYQSGFMAELFRQRKARAERRGFTVIPILESYSHLTKEIALDRTLVPAEQSISEFDEAHPQPTREILDKIMPCTRNWNAETWGGYLGYDGIAAAGDLKENKGAAEFFGETLRLIRRNWVSGTPAFIHIGHDEWGYNCAPYARLGKSRDRPESIARLLALEIDARIQQVDAELGGKTTILIWGDGLVPADYGKTYETAGDSATGAGGVLKILDSAYHRRSRIIVMPWIYSGLDGEYIEGRNTPFSKPAQLAYLDRLGYRFIACAGEDGLAYGTSQNPAGIIDKTQRTIFEWVKAAQTRSAGWAGLGYLVWNPFSLKTETTPPVRPSYNAALLAYLGWTQGGQNLSPYLVYAPEVFNGVNSVQSREDRDWVEGKHYPRNASQKR